MNRRRRRFHLREQVWREEACSTKDEVGRKKDESTKNRRDKPCRLCGLLFHAELGLPDAEHLCACRAKVGAAIGPIRLVRLWVSGQKESQDDDCSDSQREGSCPGEQEPSIFLRPRHCSGADGPRAGGAVNREQRVVSRFACEPESSHKTPRRRSAPRFELRSASGAANGRLPAAPAAHSPISSGRISARFARYQAAVRRRPSSRDTSGIQSRSRRALATFA